MDYGGKLFSIENWMPTDKKAKKIIDAQIDSKELKSKKGVPSSFRTSNSKKPRTPMNSPKSKRVRAHVAVVAKRNANLSQFKKLKKKA